LSCEGRAEIETPANTNIPAEVEIFTETGVSNNDILFTPITDLPWYLRLINDDFPLDSTFTLDLVEIEPGHLIDVRIYESTRQMLDDAAAEGLQLLIISAFRSYEEQKSLFELSMQDWYDQEYSLLDAFHQTSTTLKLPGNSEHQSGLALDIVATHHTSLDDELVNTPEIQWLKTNAWRYGFILRYPEDSIHITGIIYEPWHWRYVGVDVAQEIHERGITLEEFLGVYP